MHLTPEQIDRQPFRMARRGYDIVQVRDFLREVANEMRERQRVRDRLVETGDRQAAAEAEAKTVVDEARATAASIIADARGEAENVERKVDRAHADQIVAEARIEAEAIIESSEERARERSGVVIAEAQARLDQLLAEEREVRKRIDQRAVGAVDASDNFTTDQTELDSLTADARDRTAVVRADTSLAEFMKATLRHEVHSS